MPSQVATCLRLARQFSANPAQVSDLLVVVYGFGIQED